MNTARILPLLALVLALFPAAATAFPISLDAGSPASVTLTPMPLDSKDNPLHLTPSQQLHINARKLKFQRAASAILRDKQMNYVNKGIKVRAMEKEANDDIVAMLDAGQKARVLAAMRSAAGRTQSTIEMSKARQALIGRYLAERASLMKTMTPGQAKRIMNLEKSSQMKMQAIMADKTLSKPQKMAKIQTLFASYRLERDALYTPNQRAIIQSMMAIAQQARTVK